MTKHKVLVVDDDLDIRKLISIYLTNEGYQPLEAQDGEEAVLLLKKEQVDLIIMDVMMPNVDGLKATMEIRAFSKVPIIFLSAKGEQMDKISGLTVGADDYVAKPFHPLELMARVKSQLRRYLQFHLSTAKVVDQEVLQIDELIIKPNSHQVFVSEREVRLTPREFQILFLLASHPGKVFSIANIYESVWGEPSVAAENTIMVHIRKIREKIEENSRKPKMIKTVWGVGYKIGS